MSEKSMKLSCRFIRFFFDRSIAKKNARPLINRGHLSPPIGCCSRPSPNPDGKKAGTFTLHFERVVTALLHSCCAWDVSKRALQVLLLHVSS
jgi:hypothetical protein